MGQVSVNINGRTYQIACDNGQEEHLEKLSEYVNKKIGDLVSAVGQIGDAHLLVMASVLIADELSDALSRQEAAAGKAVTRKTARKAAATDPEAGVSADLASRLKAEDALGFAMESLAKRIETVAQRLERA